MGECRQQKHTQHAPSTKTECDYLNGWIKKRSHTQKSHPKVVNPRDIAGERKKNKQNKKKTYTPTGSAVERERLSHWVLTLSLRVATRRVSPP